MPKLMQSVCEGLLKNFKWGKKSTNSNQKIIFLLTIFHFSVMLRIPCWMSELSLRFKRLFVPYVYIFYLILNTFLFFQWKFTSTMSAATNNYSTKASLQWKLGWRCRKPTYINWNPRRFDWRGGRWWLWWWWLFLCGWG